jgi:pilus assembly protein CpaC
MINRHRQSHNIATGFRLCLGVVLLILQTRGLMAQPQEPALPAQGQPIPVKPDAEAPQSETGQTLHLLVGRSLVITAPTRIKRVSIADPAVAEALVVSPTQILVNGKAPGGVSLLVWDEADQSQAFEVSVDIDILGLTQKIHEVFPAEPVRIETSKDVVILSGNISSSTVADKILEVVKNAAPKVTSLMQVPPPTHAQILLQVRFADVNRQKLNQLGFNLLSLPGSKNIGSISTQQFSPATLNSTGLGSGFAVSDLLNIFLFRPDLNFAATIQALQNENVLEILAEPNLLTMSGKEASFLAGGEFPYPVIQGTTAGGTAAVTIQFKEFGVRLNFTPTLMPDGVIHLKVKPEVSSLDFADGLVIQGFTIPALTTDRVESEMDLKDGQSFAIAGLLDNRVTEQLSKIPGIGDIPILGKLFQSRSITKSKNELIIVVTPRIVQPMNSEPPIPVMPRKFIDPLPGDHPPVVPPRP